MNMDASQNKPSDTIQVFRQCGTCSQTFAHLLNRAFNHSQENEERALDPLAGGILNHGHQCGMLWGAALAAGAEAYRRHSDPEEALAVAVTATQHIVASFLDRTATVNCREIIGIDLSKVFGLIKFIVRTTLQAADKNPCYQLAAQWAPEAIQSAEEGLSGEPIGLSYVPVSCASEVARRFGASEEEAVMVAGFAGGLGLSGQACGALSAAIWLKTLAWCREHPGKRPPYFNNPQAKGILKAFQQRTGSEMSCRQITGRRFATLEDHAAFIREGGCRQLMDALAQPS